MWAIGHKAKARPQRLGRFSISPVRSSAAPWKAWSMPPKIPAASSAMSARWRSKPRCSRNCWARVKSTELTEPEFYDLAAFITPVRRRIGAWLDRNGFAAMRGRLVALLDGWSDLATADQRLNAFVASFPADRDHRWTRDLGAEVLHFTAPDRYPLMTRWMWDARVNTGVLREIWHSDNNAEPGDHHSRRWLCHLRDAA